MRSWDDDPDAANKSEHKGILEAYNWSQGTIITPVLVNNHSVFILKASQWFHFHVFYPDTILIIQSSLFRFLTMLTISQITIILNFVIFSNQERFYPLKIPQPIRQHFNLTTRTPSPSSLRLPRDLKSRDVINIGFNQWESRLHSNRPITGLETDFKSIFDEQGDTITISEDAGCCERLLQIK